MAASDDQLLPLPEKPWIWLFFLLLFFLSLIFSLFCHHFCFRPHPYRFPFGQAHHTPPSCPEWHTTHPTSFLLIPLTPDHPSKPQHMEDKTRAPRPYFPSFSPFFSLNLTPPFAWAVVHPSIHPSIPLQALVRTHPHCSNSRSDHQQKNINAWGVCGYTLLRQPLHDSFGRCASPKATTLKSNKRNPEGSIEVP